MEFKGTQEEWIISNSIGFISDKQDCFAIAKVFCNTFISEEEQKANLLLISKAPKMLEMLNNILSKVYESDISVDQIDAEEIEKLIKESTEL